MADTSTCAEHVLNTCANTERHVDVVLMTYGADKAHLRLVKDHFLRYKQRCAGIFDLKLDARVM